MFIYTILIGIILILLAFNSCYDSIMLKRYGVYSITTEFKRESGSKSGINYSYSFLTQTGLKIEGQYFKPQYNKHAETNTYYVVYNSMDPNVNVLLENKSCCDGKDSLLFKKITKKEWSIFDF